MVGDFPADPASPGTIRARLYHPMEPGQDRGTQIAVRLQPGAAEAFGARLREMTTAVDPMLRLTGVKALSDVYRGSKMGLHWATLALGLVTLSVLMLCAAGIYALMSVTVTRRRREIGIRLALGADRGQIVRGIFSRAAMQLAIGVLLGALLAAGFDAIEPDLMEGRGIWLLPAVSLFMILVGLLAACGPARRSLRINPIDTLKAE
jgi:predicted lysophospholipase L1 biosynthesis ABC-type transport system permease subunit